MFAVGALKASGTYGAPYQPAIRATSAYGSRRDGHELCPLVSSSYGPCNEGRSTFSLTFSSPGTFRVFPLSPRFPSVALGPAVMRFLSCLVCSPLFVSTAGPFCGSLIDEIMFKILCVRVLSLLGRPVPCLKDWISLAWYSWQSFSPIMIALLNLFWVFVSLALFVASVHHD